MTSQNSVSCSIRRRLVGIASFLPVLLIAGSVAVAQERDGGLPPIPRVFPGEQNAEVDVPSWATANKPVHSINLLDAAIPDNDRTDYFAGAAAAGTEVTDLIDDTRLVGASTISASSAGVEILGNQFVRVEPADLLKPAPGDQMNSAIVSDPQNNLYAAYEDRNVFLVSQNGDTTVVRGIRVIKSTDLGRTWTYLLTLGERGEYLTGPSLAYAQGFVFVSYVRSNGNLTVFRKPVSGWSGVAQFSPPVPGEIRTGIQAGSRWVMRARIVSDSKLFESTGNSALYLAYVIAKKATLYDTVADLYLTRSLTLGDDWTQPQALVDDNRLEAYEEYRAVGMDVGGSALQPRLHVAYSYRAGGALELHSTTSTDFGATFPPSTVIATQETGHMYSIDVSAFGPKVVTSVTRQAACVFSCYSEVMTWYTNNGGQVWNPNRIAIQAAHADVSHDGDGNFYAVYWKADGTELLEAGQATPLIGSPPVELSPSESRGLVFEADPGVTGLWSGAGAMTTYSVSTEPPDIGFESTFFTGITGNRIVPFSEADISLAPRVIDVFQGASPPASVVPDPSWPSTPGRAVVAVEKDIFGKMAVDLTYLHRRAGITGVRPLLELAATANGKLPGLARGSSVFVVEFDAGRPVQDVVGVYQSDPNVLFAEPDYLYERDAVPNDPLYSKQWGLHNTEQAVPYPEGPLVGLWGTDIDAERAWDISTGSPGVVVAVIDDGVDASHPEFAGRVLPGYDFASDDSDAGPEEGDGHGTAVAGIIAAAGNNGIGVAGVAWGVGVLPARVFDQGLTSSSIISRAIIWSTDQGASVINMSLGGPAYSRLIEMAVDYAHTLDALVISAAGNGNIDNRVIAHYPAGYRNSMSIGALSPCNTRKTSANSSLVPDGRGKDPAGMSCDEEYWWGSHFGDLDVLAPGTRIHTTDVVGPGGYDDGDYLATFNGTSAASPFVAGVAALVRSVAPALTNDEVRAVLQLSAVDMGDPGWDADTGHGRVNAYRALLLAQGMETPGEILVHNSGSIPLVLGGITPDRPWIHILSSPASVMSGGVGTIDFSVDWNDPAFAAGLPIQAGIEIVANDPDEQQSIVTVTAVPVAAACRPTWTVPLTVAGSSGTLTTLFGEGVNATEGLDAGCGERIATDGLSAFELPVGGNDSRTDIRAMTGENVWTLALNGSDSYQLSWSSEDLPDGSFLLAVGNEAPVDMRAVQAMTISDPLISSVVISRRDMVCIPFGRRPGWNLRTVPVAVGDATLRGAFPPVLRAYELRGEYARVTEVEAGRGYWTFFDGRTPNDAGFESICGRIVPSEERQIELVPGWNMIGTFEVPVGLSQLVTDPPGLLTDSVRTFFRDKYVAVDSLFPTVAYWVRSSGSGALRFVEPNAALESAFAAGRTAASSAAAVGDANLASRTSRSGAAVEIVLGLRASNGDQLDLKFGLDPCATIGWDECVGEEILPPFPPKSDHLNASFAGDSDTRAQFACTGCNYGSSPNQRAKNRRFGLVDIRTGDRGANLDVYHFFRIQWPIAEDSVSFVWNLPQGATAILEESVDEDDGEISRFMTVMAGVGSAVLTDSTVTDFRLAVTYDDVISTINVAPQAVDDIVTTLPNRPVTVFPLFNDEDADGDPLTLLSYTQPDHGEATSPRPDAIQYIPFPTFAGVDTLKYVVRDPAGGLDTALVVIRVTEDAGNPPLAITTRSDAVLRDTRFTVNVEIGSPVLPVDGLLGAAVELRFDPEVLAVIPESIVPGGFMGRDLITLDPVLDPLEGSLALSVARRRDDAGVSGSGSMARISFVVLPSAAAGPTIIDIVDALAVDTLGNEIAVTPVAGAIEIVEPLIVWPGRTGFDLFVTSTDVFPIGDCYGVSGPTRPDGVGTAWQPREVMSWYFPVGESRCTSKAVSDPATADANGDGFIDALDVEAISENFGLSLPTAPKVRGRTTASVDSAYVPISPIGVEFSLDVTLGTAGTPVANVVGVAARLTLDPRVLSLAGVEGGSSLDDGDLLSFEHFDPATGEVETALVRKRGSEPFNASGTVIKVRVEVTAPMTEPAKIVLSSVHTNVEGAGVVAVTTEPAGVSEPVVVSNGVSAQLPDQLGVASLYPNPVTTTATVGVEVPAAGDLKLTLFDALGRRVAVPFAGRVTAGRYNLPVEVSHLPSGTYFLRLESEGQQVTVPMVHVR